MIPFAFPTPFSPLGHLYYIDVFRVLDRCLIPYLIGILATRPPLALIMYIVDIELPSSVASFFPYRLLSFSVFRILFSHFTVFVSGFVPSQCPSDRALPVGSCFIPNLTCGTIE
ncbi:hypothetical protein BDM02DRAFT_3114858 [Thelephora ganbajun]|uniref:Uncharacterized protein n=1 Tax=Thelephora ganbajun TaxID=370292 RepID=A0ACB6ZGW1_THEGA|nr:hypothetical protein BDM02DRAFT_3114858 [Thelephora ganbajun]